MFGLLITINFKKLFKYLCVINYTNCYIFTLLFVFEESVGAWMFLWFMSKRSIITFTQELCTYFSLEYWDIFLFQTNGDKLCIEKIVMDITILKFLNINDFIINLFLFSDRFFNYFRVPMNIVHRILLSCSGFLHCKAINL